MLENPNSLLILATILTAGVLGGFLVRMIHLPQVTGQILMGILLGPSVLDVFGLAESRESLEQLRPITHFALGLIAVAIGSHLNIPRLRNAFKRLSILLLFEVTLVPLFVFGAVYLMPGTGWTTGILLAALAISTAPATIVAVVREIRARGVFVKTLLAAVALNNIACILLFEVAYTIARVELAEGSVLTASTIFLAPLQELLFNALLGGTMGILLIAATRHVVRSDLLATASLITILFTSGLADYLQISPLLSCLFLGVALANITPEKEEIGDAVFVDFEMAILAAFFTLAGIELNFDYLVPGGLLALLLVASRLTGKVSAGLLAMRFARTTESIRRYLGLALIPQAGVAIGLMLLVAENQDFAPIRDLFIAVGLTSVTINEIIGPILTRIAVVKSGEKGKDRPRLLDFIHEENIVTGLQANTREDALEKLVDLLIQSNQLKIDRERLLHSILEREKEASTAVGRGLAVPHGVLQEGKGIVGIVGLSREGIPWDAPDGRPVRCTVLLAYPDSHSDRHHAVISALARSIGFDWSIRRQLYTARSAAHAYEILHAEDAEDFNYYLEAGEEE